MEKTVEILENEVARLQEALARASLPRQDAPLRFVGTPDALQKMFEALAAARVEFGPILKDKTGREGNQSYRYADLNSMVAATAPALGKHGLVVLQPMVRSGARTTITTILAGHGARLESDMEVLESQKEHGTPVKQYGSLTTYFRRYGFQAVLQLDGDSDLDEDTEPRQERRQDAPVAPPRQQQRNAAPPAREPDTMLQRPQPKQEAAREPQARPTAAAAGHTEASERSRQDTSSKSTTETPTPGAPTEDIPFGKPEPKAEEPARAQESVVEPAGEELVKQTIGIAKELGISNKVQWIQWCMDTFRKSPERMTPEEGLQAWRKLSGMKARGERVHG